MSQSLSNTLNKIHQTMQKDLINSQEEQMAKELENFLQAAIYDEGWTEKPGEGSIFKGILTQKFFDEIKKDSNLRELFGTQTKSSTEQGKRGEEAFATVIAKLINQSLQKKTTQEQVTKWASKIIAGDKTTAVLLSEYVTKDIQSVIRVDESGNQYYTTAQRMQKVDVDASALITEIKATGKTRQLMSILSGSVKNYQDFSVTLEKLNIRKAYAAIVSRIKSVTEEEAEELYKQYYREKTAEIDSIVTAHLQHMQNIYALTGYGQVYLNDVGKVIMANYSKFLFYNNPSKRRIKVKSTSKIVKDLLGDPQQANNFRRSNSGKIKYYIEH